MSAVTHYGLAESDRQLIIRALAVQALTDPGFDEASRQAAIQLSGEPMFEEFVILLEDTITPAKR